MNISNKWVCITKDWDFFTYGKIYEGELQGNLLNVPNDLGEYYLPALFRYEAIETHKESRRYGIPRKKVYYFITLEEWRQQRIEKII
jgi:hypothetical protein